MIGAYQLAFLAHKNLNESQDIEEVIISSNDPDDEVTLDGEDDTVMNEILNLHKRISNIERTQIELKSLIKMLLRKQPKAKH